MDELNGNGKRGLPKLREILRRQKQDSEVSIENDRQTFYCSEEQALQKVS